jgi:alanine dehydrogenase
MIIGIPSERKVGEQRVALTPSGAAALTGHGHTVLVERSAGAGSGFQDAAYEAAGAAVIDDAAELWGSAELVVKVKEPIEAEWPHLRHGLLLFCYLHLAADLPLTRRLVETGVTAVAYETVEDGDGHLPLLIPMSEVAGRLAPQAAARCLERSREGNGVLLGGVPGVAPARVVILGAGTVGVNAGRVALGMGADITIVDKDVAKLRAVEQAFPAIRSLAATNADEVADAVRGADVVIGAALLPGAQAPRLVSERQVEDMRDGAVLLDVAIDQGGCFATSRPTSFDDPTYVIHGVTHYCVTNMPACVARTSTLALTNVTQPYVVRLARHGLAAMAADDRGFAGGINVTSGQVTCSPVAEAAALEFTPPGELLVGPA